MRESSRMARKSKEQRIRELEDSNRKLHAVNREQVDRLVGFDMMSQRNLVLEREVKELTWKLKQAELTIEKLNAAIREGRNLF